ncbi:MAG: DUF2065 domain-containing protein [Aestuariivirga sp.]|jgi:uncharacterized protein YjeT (DUF2065 family)|uniref:DUF2065 domain-containing protein n=1 Tax=Aestuariivirga sp. TaxID=2650926 RepID=UPI0038CFB2D3
MLDDLLTALGLVLVIEGCLYALVPSKLRAMMLSMQSLTDDQLRLGGIAAMALGVLAVAMVRVGFS